MVAVWDQAREAAPGPIVRQRADHVVFSPDGQRLATCQYSRDSLGGDCRIWDLRSGKVVHQFKAHTGFALCAAYSPDSQRIATAGQDGTVIVWDAGTGRELFAFRGHGLPVQDLAFSPDGLRLASVSNDGARIWDVRPFDGPVPEGLATLSLVPTKSPRFTGDDKVADRVKKPLEVGKDGLKLKGRLTGETKGVPCPVKMEKGKSYHIRLSSGQFDAYLFMKDEKGKQLDCDDDSGGGTNALLEFVAPASGVFVVLATSLFMDAAGDYELVITRKP
jgi:hypothetical protein